MRTHKILAAASLLAVSVASALAQPYSQNIVGYINLTLRPGFNLVGNQLDNGSGSNTLNNVFPAANLPDGTKIYKQIPGGLYSRDVSQQASFVGYPSGWYTDDANYTPSTTTASPGQGIFVEIPPGPNVTVTLVGSVRVGTNTIALNPGFNLVASVTPESYELTTTNFPAVEGAKFYQYDGVNYSRLYNARTPGQGYPEGWYTDDANFTPAVAKPAVGEAFFLEMQSATNWTRVFNP